MDKEYLCKCINCGTVMYDENPQVDAKKQNVPKNTDNMKQCIDNDGSVFWGCPNCETDEHLMDI